MGEPTVPEKAAIVKVGYHGNYMQETGRIFRIFIADCKRMALCINNKSLVPLDEDLAKFGITLDKLTRELEMVLVHKFPYEVDITEEDMLKDYGIKIDKKRPV